MMNKKNEKYYWVTEYNQLIPKDKLSDSQVCNIVQKFGKNWLNANGHQLIVQRYERMDREYDFFSAV